jgi:tRNA (guanine37-N1)-methyltransferase
MRFDVVTLFPELFAPHLEHGITRRAFGSGAVDVRLWQLRDHADDAYRRVDDRPYGGGPGMVMLVEPLERALAAVRAGRGAPAPVVHFTPTGRRIDQAVVAEFAAGSGAVLLCGRYEGIDERVRQGLATEELSLGDFVLTGGEVAALAVTEATVRLIPGALGDAESAETDSFSDGLLDWPHYTRPAEIQGMGVPDVLLSGDHGRVRRWRRKEALRATRERRPDLLAAARLTDEDRKLLREIEEEASVPAKVGA